MHRPRAKNYTKLITSSLEITKITDFFYRWKHSYKQILCSLRFFFKKFQTRMTATLVMRKQNDSCHNNCHQDNTGLLGQDCCLCSPVLFSSFSYTLAGRGGQSKYFQTNSPLSHPVCIPLPPISEIRFQPPGKDSSACSSGFCSNLHREVVNVCVF